MGRKVTIVDDFTGAEIDGKAMMVTLTLAIIPTDAPEKTEAELVEGEFELSEFSTTSLTSLAKGDLTDFILRMRPLVKLATPDSDAVRKWAKSAHPEMTVNERGRIPAEVMALYRQEVVLKTSAPDAK